MFSAFAALVISKTEGPKRTREPVTPGRLYRLLSVEFNGVRRECGCEMPMLYLRDRRGVARPNWGLHRGASLCRHCHAVIDTMIERFSQRYELTDPYGWTPDDLRIE